MAEYPKSKSLKAPASHPSWIASAWTNVGADRIVLSLACFSTHQVLVSAATRLARINAVLRVRAVLRRRTRMTDQK